MEGFWIVFRISSKIFLREDGLEKIFQAPALLFPARLAVIEQGVKEPRVQVDLVASAAQHREDIEGIGAPHIIFLVQRPSLRQN